MFSWKNAPCDIDAQIAIKKPWKHCTAGSFLSTSTAPKLEQEPGTNDFKSNFLAVRLLGTLNGLWNFNIW